MGITKEDLDRLQRHFRGGEDEWSESELEGGFQPIRRTRKDPETEKAKGRKQGPLRRKQPRITSASMPSTTPPTEEKEHLMERRHQSGFSAFGRALYLARQVETREDDTTELERIVSELGELARNLVFRLQAEVLEGRTRLPALFAVARAAKLTGDDGRVRNMAGVAYATAAVYNALHRGGMSVEDMIFVGLAEPITFKGQDGKLISKMSYKIGRDALAHAAPKLRQRGRHAAAETLENYLQGVERKRVLAKARREAAGANAEPSPEDEA